MINVSHYHSTEDPYEIVSAVHGHNPLHVIAELVADMRVLGGTAHVFDYVEGRERAVTSETYVVKDPRGLRVMGMSEFTELYGESLSVREVKRWKNARPAKRVPVYGSLTVGNAKTTSCSRVVYGDTDEEMVVDAVRQGRQVFGDEADLKVDLCEVRCEVNPFATQVNKRFYTTAFISKQN